MPIMRIIGRLILRKSSPPRWLSTATASSTPAPQQKKSRNTLFYKVVGASPTSGVVDVLNKWVAEGKPVKKSDIINLSNHFRSHKNFQSALQLYEWMDRSNLETKSSDNAVRIDLLAKAEGVASAEKYFDSIPVKTSNMYGALLSCYCKVKDLDKALQTFEKLKVLNSTTTLNYNNVLSLYYNLEQPDKVVSLVQKMEENNISADLFTYNLLINSHAALKNLDACEEVVKNMESANKPNIKPDLFTYGNLATVYFNAGVHEKATTYLELMEKMGTENDTAAREACRTRLRLYSMMNDISGVTRAWEALKSADGKPSNTSYLFMLLAVSKLGNQDNLEKIFKEWEESCTLYDYRLPNVLLEFYLSRDLIEEATAFYKRLKGRGAAPNVKTLELFTTLCLKNSEIDLALEYLEMGLGKAKSRGNRWFPRSETVEAFIGYFEEKNDVERGGKFIESMKKHNRLESNAIISYIKTMDEGKVTTS